MSVGALVFGRAHCLGQAIHLPFSDWLGGGERLNVGLLQVCCGWKKGLKGTRCSVPEVCGEFPHRQLWIFIRSLCFKTYSQFNTQLEDL